LHRDIVQQETRAQVVQPIDQQCRTPEVIERVLGAEVIDPCAALDRRVDLTDSRACRLGLRSPLSCIPLGEKRLPLHI